MKLTYQAILLYTLALIIPSVLFGQSQPAIFLSKNTVISILQDQLKNVVTDKSLAEYIFCAPSYCFKNSDQIQFNQVIIKDKIDYDKFDLLNNCHDLNIIKQQLQALGYRDFVILSGNISLTPTNINTGLSQGIGSNEVLSKLAAHISEYKSIATLSIKDLAVYYDQSKLEKINPKAIFSAEGLLIGNNEPYTSQIESQEWAKIVNELQSTGITSIGTIIPMEFINQQFLSLTLPYNDGKGTNINLQLCRFEFENDRLKFHCVLSGSVLYGKTMQNRYTVTAELNATNLDLISIKSTILEGTNRSEASQMRVLLNYLENELRGKLIFSLPNQKYYDISSINGKSKINIRTFYGHFINDAFVFVNTFELRE